LHAAVPPELSHVAPVAVPDPTWLVTGAVVAVKDVQVVGAAAPVLVAPAQNVDVVGAKTPAA
jgi:hypothetical protein